MQKIEFLNPRNRLIEITPKNGPYVFERVTGLGAADVAMTSTQPAGMDGGLFHGLRLDSREVTLTFHVHGRTLEEMYANKAEIVRLLSSTYSRDGKQGTLWYENDHGRWWVPAVVMQAPREAGRRRGTYMPMQVVFYCADPFLRVDEPVIDKLAYISGGFRFPLKMEIGKGVTFGLRGYRVNIENKGDAPTPIEIEINGPAERPRIENKTTGEALAINRELEDGDILRINTQPGAKHATITRAEDGAIESAMSYIDAESKWIQLAPGMNELEYTSGDDTTTATALITVWPRVSGV